MNDEPESRYSSSELFDLFLEFMHDTRERQRIYTLDLSPHQHAMPLIIQFISYVRNHHFDERMKELEGELKKLEEKAKRRKMEMFGSPTKGDLINARNPE